MTYKHSFLYCRNLNAFTIRSLTFILVIHLSFLSSAQNFSNPNQIGDTAYHRKLITDFFQLQASVKYIYQCALSPVSTKVAWCADGEKGQEIFIKSLSNTNDS